MQIINKINITDIYDKNLNFLIGSGASSGLFPTLALPMEDGKYTFETLLDEVKKENNDKVKNKLKTLVLMAYYQTLILPVLQCSYNNDNTAHHEAEVLENYKVFIKNILHILGKSDNKVCNIFTTNYDGCFPYIADKILQKGDIDFSINDGTSGFFKKQLEARNYNQTHHRTGMFSEYREQLPTINIIPLHGSAYWNLENEKIFVDYKIQKQEPIDLKGLESFCELLNDERSLYGDLHDYADNSNNQSNWLTDEVIGNFWQEYKKIPIVNPTKDKFNQTVLEEHFYQMLRLLSYELEKEQTVVIAFGFSFADEHILNLIKRSLSNPHLKLYICCYSENTVDSMTETFRSFSNVSLIKVLDEDKKTKSLNFSEFNKSVFNLDNLVELHNTDGKS